MNIKRGFNRLYVVLAIIWAFYCLIVYPRQQIRKADVQYGEETKYCFDSQYVVPDGRAECLKHAEQDLREKVEPWTYKNFYYWAWLFLLLAILVFPLVFYGCIRVVAAVVVWIWRGFRRTPA